MGTRVVGVGGTRVVGVCGLWWWWGGWLGSGARGGD